MPGTQAQLAALDDQFQAKVLAEVERQGVLEAEKAELDARWDAQTRALVGGHDAAMQELTQDFTLRQQARSHITTAPEFTTLLTKPVWALQVSTCLHMFLRQAHVPLRPDRDSPAHQGSANS